MGTLLYGRTREFECDDRTLEHLRFVIAARLRKRESFFLVWPHEESRGGGSASLWISPDVPLAFHFSGSEREPLSRVWAEALMRVSYSDRGLVVIPERAVSRGARRGGSASADRA